MNTNEHQLVEYPERGCVCKTSCSNIEIPVASGIPLTLEIFRVLRLVLCTQPRSYGCIGVNSCPFVVNL